MYTSNNRVPFVRTADMVSVVDPLAGAHPVFVHVFTSFFESATKDVSQREDSPYRIRRRVGYHVGLSEKNVKVSYQSEYQTVHVMYHQTSIVKFMPDKFELDTGGWGSRTTGGQMEQWLNWAGVSCRISHRYQRGDAQQGTLFIEIGGQTYIIEDGMQFSYEGQPLTGAAPFTGNMVHQGQRRTADSLGLQDVQGFQTGDVVRVAWPAEVWKESLEVNGETEFLTYADEIPPDVIARFVGAQGTVSEVLNNESEAASPLLYSIIFWSTLVGTTVADWLFTTDDLELVHHAGESSPDRTADIVGLLPENWRERVDAVREKYPEWTPPEGFENIDPTEDVPPENPTQNAYPGMTPAQMREAHAEHQQRHDLYLQKQQFDNQRETKIAREFESMARQYANDHDWEVFEDQWEGEYAFCLWGKRFKDGMEVLGFEGVEDRYQRDNSGDDTPLLFDETAIEIEWADFYTSKYVMQQIADDGNYDEYNPPSPETYYSYTLSEERPEFYNHNHTEASAWQWVLSSMLRTDEEGKPFVEAEFYAPAHWPVPRAKPDPDQYSMFTRDTPSPRPVSPKRPRTEKQLRPDLYSSLTFNTSAALQTTSDMADRANVQNPWQVTGNVIVFFDDGTEFMGLRSDDDLGKINEYAIEQGHVGYISGETHGSGAPMHAYYKYIPDAIELRHSGVWNATWVALPVADLVDPTRGTITTSLVLTFDKTADMVETLQKQDEWDEQHIVLHDVEGIARKSGTDEGNAEWVQYDDSDSPDDCCICGAEIREGWYCADDGSLVACDSHVVFADDLQAQADALSIAPDFEIGDLVMIDVDSVARAWPYPHHTYFFAGRPGRVIKVYARGHSWYTRHMNNFKKMTPPAKETHDEGTLYVVEFDPSEHTIGSDTQVFSASELYSWDSGHDPAEEVAKAKKIYDQFHTAHPWRGAALASELQFAHIGSTMTKQAYEIGQSAWVSPEGVTHGVEYSHEDSATDIARRYYSREFATVEYSGYVFLLARGWLRISFDNISFDHLTAATRGWLRQYIEDDRIPKGRSVHVERWRIDHRTYQISNYQTFYEGPAVDAWAAISALAVDKHEGLMAVADWEEYLRRMSFDPQLFFQYARPGQVWSFVRDGQGARAGQRVRRFVHLSNIDSTLGQVDGTFAYSWEGVMGTENYPGAARPVDDEWQDVRYIATYKPHVDVDDEEKAGAPWA